MPGKISHTSQVDPIISVLVPFDAHLAAEFPQLLQSLLAQNEAAWQLVVDSRMWAQHVKPNQPQVITVEMPLIRGSSDSFSINNVLNQLAQQAAAPYVHIYQGGVMRCDWVAQCTSAIAQTAPTFLYWDHDELGAERFVAD